FFTTSKFRNEGASISGRIGAPFAGAGFGFTATGAFLSVGGGSCAFSPFPFAPINSLSSWKGSFAFLGFGSSGFGGGGFFASAGSPLRIFGFLFDCRKA